MDTTRKSQLEAPAPSFVYSSQHRFYQQDNSFGRQQRLIFWPFGVRENQYAANVSECYLAEAYCT